MSEAPRARREGLLVGLIAYAAVAVFYAGFDFLAARGALFTVNMLGKAVFRGLPDPAVLQLPVPLDPAGILGYNALHLVASLLIGMIVVGLIARAERDPGQRRLALSIIASGFLGTIIAVGLLSDSMRRVLPWWSIIVANTLAVVLAGSYVLRKRPGILERMVSAA